MQHSRNNPPVKFPFILEWGLSPPLPLSPSRSMELVENFCQAVLGSALFRKTPGFVCGSAKGDKRDKGDKGELGEQGGQGGLLLSLVFPSSPSSLVFPSSPSSPLSLVSLHSRATTFEVHPMEWAYSNGFVESLSVF